MTVHLDRGTDVVIVEGKVAGSTEDAAVVADCDSKYDYSYDLSTYGALTRRAAPEGVGLALGGLGWT